MSRFLVPIHFSLKQVKISEFTDEGNRFSLKKEIGVGKHDKNPNKPIRLRKSILFVIQLFVYLLLV